MGYIMSINKNGIIGAVCSVAAIAQPASAFDVTGGEVSFGYSAFSEENELSRLTFDGAVEYGFAPSFGVQLDVAHTTFGATSLNTNSATLHAVYHVNDSAALGAFATLESAGIASNHIGNVAFYGLEAGYDANALVFEGYWGTGEESGVSIRTLGGEAGYRINDRFSVGVSHDRLTLEDGEEITLHNTALRGSYDAENGVEFYAEVGRAGIQVPSESISESTNFFGLGLTYTFGRGATFGKRTVTQIVPGL